MQEQQRLRVQIQFKPGLTLTQIGNSLHLLPHKSYLQITNCIQLQQVNTFNTEQLKISQSCYLYFPFSQQYIGYNLQRNQLFVTTNTKQKCAFKIIIHQFNWNSRGVIQLGGNFSYRIILAELNSKVLTNFGGKLRVVDGEDSDQSLVALKTSLYGRQGPIPCRIVGLESGLTLCYRKKKTCSLLRPSLCQYMMQIESKQIEEKEKANKNEQTLSLCGIRHVNSNSYLIKSSKQYIFFNQIPPNYKHTLSKTPYNPLTPQYTIFQTLQNTYLNLPQSAANCQTSTNQLQSIIQIKGIKEEQVKQILISVWLKSEYSLKSNINTIVFILEYCQNIIKYYNQIYQFQAVEKIIQEGLFFDLENVMLKYQWGVVGGYVGGIVGGMLGMRVKWITGLFGVPNLYQRLMQQPQISKKVQKIRLYPQQTHNIDTLLSDIHTLIFTQPTITLTTMKTLLVISPIILSPPPPTSSPTSITLHKQIKQYITHACQKMIPQIQRKSISSFFSLALKIVKINSNQIYFSQNVVSYLSLNLVEEEGLGLEDKIGLVQIFQGEVGPYAYIVSEQQSIRLIVPDNKHQPTLSHYTNTILPKNPRFQPYQKKLLSIQLLSYHIKTNQILDIIDYKQYLKYIQQNITNYNYQQNPQLFIKYCFKAIKLIIQRLHIIIVGQILSFDSALNGDMKLEKCKKQFKELLGGIVVLDLPVVRGIVGKEELSGNQLEIFLGFVGICEGVVYPDKSIMHLLDIMKQLDQPSPYIIKCISLFLQRQHSFNPKLASQKLIQQFKHMQLQQLQIIAIIIHENDMYDKICFKTQAFYDIINIFSTDFGKKNISQVSYTKNRQSQRQRQRQRSLGKYFMEEDDGSKGEEQQLGSLGEGGLGQRVFGKLLDGIRILETIVSRRSAWLYIDSEYLFLNNLLQLIGGVVSMPIYQNYQLYICSVEPEKWSLHFFRLCQCFFQMSPVGLKKRFVIEYHEHLKSENSELKLQRLLIEKGPQFIVAYIKLLISFADYHSSKDLIYQIMGDETLYNLLFKFRKPIQLRIKILLLMNQSRKRYNEYEQISQNPTNQLFLKKGTQLIRHKLSQQSSIILEGKQRKFLPQYTTVLLDYLYMREQISLHTQITQDQALVVEGTNKIFAFKLAEAIGVVVKGGQIGREMVERIQWFQNQYKIGIDIIQLTQLQVDLQKPQKISQNFTYNYMLTMPAQIEATTKTLLTKLDISTIVTTLIKITLTLSFENSIDTKKLYQILSYLHHIVSLRTYLFLEKDIYLLFVSMLKLMKMGKLSQVALIHNIVRKIILKDGHLEIQYQRIVQKNFMNNKKQMLKFLHNCINNYMIFSPLYQSTLNYFNHNGQTSICWTVSCYISMLRFLISLCKTLDLQFKAIFSQSETFQKQFIGSLIQINRQHIKQLFKDTSDAKLTIIVYQIELINNMMLGPVQQNIKTALKYRYEQIISLIKLPDQHQTRPKTFKIIIKLKKQVVQGLLILSKIHRFSQQQIHKIEQGLIMYYKSTNKLVKDDMNSIIDKYTKQNKQNIQVMNFDLTLIMYFCIVQIYQQESINTLKIMKTDALRQIRLIKSYNKKFKMFYQLYRIVSDLMSGVGRFVSRCCRKTTKKIDEAVGLFGESEQTHQQNLQQAFKFFVQNVSSVQIQVGKQLQTVYFLLLKQTQCYNTSIRKQLHRRVGLGQRQYKMLRFISQINHVILRLEIEKSIKQSTLKYKPIQIIVKNRQLWKSLNFLCACLLNLLFLDQDNIANQPIAMIVLRALSYLFCIFLFMIYFIQNLPLKRRLSEEMSKSDKPQKFKQIKACLEIFNDKTLWFAVIYFVVISASLYQQGFVAILMIDFFVRFKISKKVTQIVTRPFIQLLLIILVSVQIAFVFTYYLYFLGDTLDCSSAPECIQQTYFQYLGLTKNSVLQSQLGGVQFRSIIEFFATFFAIMINNSLIISVLLYEKQAKDIKVADWQFKVKERCFICDSERNVVDRARNNNKGFFEHIQEEHNLWNYVFYLVYLKNKDLDSLNIVENTVMTSWRQNKIDWLPTTFKA